MKLIAVAGVALSLVASTAYALPWEWSAFVVCTRENKPPRPAGHYETVVQAMTVVTKCYSVAPPGGLPVTQDQSGPPRSSLDTQTAADIPCSKIAATRQTLRDRLSDARDESRELAAAIEGGETALQVATGISQVLEVDARDAQAACSRAQSRYQAELTVLVAQMSAKCRPRGSDAFLDCLDKMLSQAENLLAGKGSALIAARACEVAQGTNDYYTRQDQVRIDLSRDLGRARDRHLDLMREIRAIELALRTFDDREKSGGDCKKN